MPMNVPRTPLRVTAWLLALALAFPVVALTAGCGSKSEDTSATAPSPTDATTAPAAPVKKPGLSNGQKAVIVLAGAALIYYLYKKHQAAQNAAAATGPGGKPQLYREEKGPNKGAIYYRDPQTHKPVWVTAPSGGVSVPNDPDAQAAQQQYGNQPAPAVPQGAQTQDATQYDTSLSSGPSGPSQ